MVPEHAGESLCATAMIHRGYVSPVLGGIRSSGTIGKGRIRQQAAPHEAPPRASGETDWERKES
jgi:hypothetical protein